MVVAPHKGVHNRQNSQKQLFICQERPTGGLKWKTTFVGRGSASDPTGEAYSTP